MKISKYKKVVLLSLVALFGCDDDEFLVEEPKSFYTVDNIFSSGEQVSQTLITLYNADRTFRTNDGAFNGIIQGKGTDVMVTPAFRFGNNFSDYTTINPDNGSIAGLFNYHYQIISFANTTLAAAEREDIAFESEAVRASIVAQARFFRAKIHGSLAQLYGSVSIVTDVASEPRFDYGQATRAEVYQFAIDELEAIINDLPEIAEQPGRVVKGAAQHFLSEFYLSLGIETGSDAAYDQAIKYASDVIDGGTYSLMTERFGARVDFPSKDVYWDLFQSNNVNYADGNRESIWTYQNDFGAVLAGDRGAQIAHPRFWVPVLRAIEGVTGLAEDVGGRGVAFFRPTPLTETEIWEPGISDGDIRGLESNIRRTVLYNDPSFMDGALIGQVVPQEAKDAGNASLADGAYYPIYEKFTTDMFEGLDQGENRSNIFRDRYAIRLPETILLRAEAHLRKGNTQGAADDINLIRNRSQCTVLATAANVDLDYILDERARELFGEESRWNTLLRMGGTVAVDRIRRYAGAQNDWVNTSLTFDFNLLPIPQSTIDRNKDATWVQNPGWENK